MNNYTLVIGGSAVSAILAFALAFVLGLPLVGRRAKTRLNRSGHSHVLGAVRSYLRVFDRVVLIFVTLIACTLAVAIGVVRGHLPTDPGSSSYVFAAWIVGSFVIGTATAHLATHAATWALVRATHRTCDVVQLGVAAMLRQGLRDAGASIVGVFAFFVVIVAALGLSVFVAQGTLSDTEQVTNAANAYGWIVSSFAAGTAICALCAHTTGGLFVAGARLGCRADPEKQPLFSAMRTLQGYVSATSARSADIMSSIAIVLAACAILSHRNASADAGPMSPVGLLALMATVFSLFCSFIGVLVVQTDNRESSASAMRRGLVVTMVLMAACLVGLTHWQFGPSWWKLALAGQIGLIVAALSLFIQRWHQPKSGIDDDNIAANDTVSGKWLIRACAVGCVVTCGAIGAFFLGKSAAIPGGATIAVALVAVGAVAPAPYLVASAFCTTMFEIATASSSRAATPMLRKRIGNSIEQLSHSPLYAGACATLAVWSAMLAVVHRSSSPLSTWIANSTKVAIVLCAGVAGTLIVVWFTAMLMQAVARIAVAVKRANGLSMCLSTALNEAIRNAFPMLIVLVIVPVLLGTIVYLSVDGSDALTVAALAISLSSSLAVMGLSNASGTRQKPCNHSNIGVFSPSEPDATNNIVDAGDELANNAADGAAIEGDTRGLSLQVLVSPCLYGSMKLLTAAVLAFVPLLFQ